MSFPVPGTLMIEPTESESKAELDRFCEAMIAIRREISEIESGRWKVEASPLRHAPHTVHDIADDNWTRAYSRAEGCFPAGTSRTDKYWCPVGRVDNVYGDRNWCARARRSGLRAGGGVRPRRHCGACIGSTANDVMLELQGSAKICFTASQRHSRSLVNSVPPHQR